MVVLGEKFFFEKMTVTAFTFFNEKRRIFLRKKKTFQRKEKKTTFKRKKKLS